LFTVFSKQKGMIMLRKWVLCVVCFASLAYSAPVPRKQPVPVQEFKLDGKTLLEWGGSDWYMWFDPKTKCSHTVGKLTGTVWDGSFAWDATSRILVVHEKFVDPESNNWMLWQVTLDKEWKGKAKVNQTGEEVSVKFSPIKE
jgi:hypothetical protein